MINSNSLMLTRGLTLLLITVFVASPVWATCGGGGGGGVGGMSGGSGGGGSAPAVYYVPWKVRQAKDPAPHGLVLYWFPASMDELQKSSLRASRSLSLYATQCVSMEVADTQVPNAEKLIGSSKLPVAVLANPDGTPVTKLENTNGKLKVEQVEKLVETEVKQRESSLDSELKDAKAKATAGDKETAVKLYRSVAAQKCMFPKKAKDAAKELKKLGQEDIAAIPSAPVFDRQLGALIERTMQRGLVAEMKSQYTLAEKFYLKAQALDPADPAPLRYLGELYRHHIGNWSKARTTFETILNMPADPLSRAVALHGLGKMTIHEGEFKKGLGLMEQSVEIFPIALAYRNLAVYWNSEGDAAKTDYYVQKALKLDPDDGYNLVFAAGFM